jgi:hypothetical protein
VLPLAVRANVGQDTEVNRRRSHLFQLGRSKCGLGMVRNPENRCLQFKSLEGKPVFGDRDRRRELMRRFAVVEGVTLDESSLNRWAAVPLAQAAADPAGATKLISAFEWIFQQVKGV